MPDCGSGDQGSIPAITLSREDILCATLVYSMLYVGRA
jgi:hypothetical protein